MTTVVPEIFLGTIKKVLNPDNYSVTLDIPGMTDKNSDGFEAFPMRSQLDEPKIGDSVLCLCLDPENHSVWFYSQLKEDGFIGFRKNGGFLELTKEGNVVIGHANVAPEGMPEFSPEEKGNSEYGSYVTFCKDGKMRVKAAGVLEVEGGKDSKIYIHGGNVVMENCKIDIKGGEVNFSGGAAINLGAQTKLNAEPSTSLSSGGIFNGLHTCPYAPHGTNSIIIGKP